MHMDQLAISWQWLSKVWYGLQYYGLQIIIIIITPIVLDAPSFSVVPEYSGETKYLNKITVEISTNVSNIST